MFSSYHIPNNLYFLNEGQHSSCYSDESHSDDSGRTSQSPVSSATHLTHMTLPFQRRTARDSLASARSLTLFARHLVSTSGLRPTWYRRWMSSTRTYRHVSTSSLRQTQRENTSLWRHEYLVSDAYLCKVQISGIYSS